MQLAISRKLLHLGLLCLKKAEGWQNLWYLLREYFAKPSFPALPLVPKQKLTQVLKAGKKSPSFLFLSPFSGAHRNIHHLSPPSLHPPEFLPPRPSCCASSSYLATTHFRFPLKSNIWHRWARGRPSGGGSGEF